MSMPVFAAAPCFADEGGVSFLASRQLWQLRGSACSARLDAERVRLFCGGFGRRQRGAIA